MSTRHKQVRTSSINGTCVLADELRLQGYCTEADVSVQISVPGWTGAVYGWQILYLHLSGELDA